MSTPAYFIPHPNSHRLACETPTQKREAMRKKLADDTAAYEKKGKEIIKVPSHVSASRNNPKLFL
jgi:hypothetical protein